MGRTPLLALQRVSAGLPGRIAVKIESRNPSGSVKDRVAAALVGEAEASGVLRPGSTVVAATSGNTGLALAHLGAARGYKVRLTVPEDRSHERIALLLYLGADVVVTQGGGMRAAMERARALVASTPGAVLLDQFQSPANPEVHGRTTAEEIWSDSHGEVAVFVAGVGTGGTVTGVAGGLRAHRPGECGSSPSSRPPPPSFRDSPPGRTPFRASAPASSLRCCASPSSTRFCLSPTSRYLRVRAASGARGGILGGISSGAAGCRAPGRLRKSSEGQPIVAMVCDLAERYVTAPRLDAPLLRRARAAERAGDGLRSRARRARPRRAFARRAAEDGFAHALRVGHETEDVLARPAVNAGDAVQAAVGVGAFLDDAVARAVAQGRPDLVLQTPQGAARRPGSAPRRGR